MLKSRRQQPLQSRYLLCLLCIGVATFATAKSDVLGHVLGPPAMEPLNTAGVVEDVPSVVRRKGIQRIKISEGGKLTSAGTFTLPVNEVPPGSKDHQTLDKHLVDSPQLLTLYIKPNCDFQNDGAEGCYIPSHPRSFAILRAFEERRRYVFMGFAVAMLVLAIIIQWTIRACTEGVSKSRDRYLKNYEEAVFKQIACVLLVVALVEIAIQSHYLGDKLEHRLFGDIKKELHYALSSITNFSHFEHILDSLLLLSLIFASFFLLFAAFLAFCAFAISRWLRRADSVDVQNAALRIEGSTEVVNYLALRYEFEDAVQQSCVPGLDPPGLYFQNYCRACTYHVASKLLLIPTSTLVVAFCITMSAFLTPVTSFAHKKEIFAMIVIASVPLLTLLSVCIVVWLVKRNLLPTDLYKYLQIRISMDSKDTSETAGVGVLSQIMPPYRFTKSSRSTCFPSCLVHLLYGTRFPNNHEVLFCFWRRGPLLLLHVSEMAIFLQLVTLSLAFVLCTTHRRIWLELYWPWAPVSVFGICFLQWLLLPSLLWNLVVVTSTSGLIEDAILQEVWETQRARTVHRFRTLIDTLRCEANLFKIERGGRLLRENWNDRCQFENGGNARQDEHAFKKLDPNASGFVTRGHIYRYLTGEGIAVRNEKEAQRWVAAFDRKNRGHLDKDDFSVLAWNVRNLLNSPLDIDAVMALFCERYGFSQDGVLDVSMLAAIFEKWHLNWTKVHVLHLFQYMTGKRGIKSINVRVFLKSLRILESNTIGTLRQAVGDLTTSSSYDNFSDGEIETDLARCHVDSLVSYTRHSTESPQHRNY